MSTYVEKSLGPGEQIYMIGRFPWPYHVLAWGSLLVFGVVGIGVVFWGLMLIHFNTTESAITSRRIVYKRGLFTRRTMELGYGAVEQVELIQSFWGRIFGFGTIDISGTGDANIRTHPLAYPVRFRQLMAEAKAEAEVLRIVEDEDGYALRASA